MTEPTPIDPFDTFLAECVDQAENQGPENPYGYIDQEAIEILTELGLNREGIDPHGERYKALYEEYMQALLSTLDSTQLDDEDKKALHYSAHFAILQRSTAEIILSGYAITARIIFDIDKDATTATHDKRRGVAIALYRYMLSPDDPILTFLNRFMPGEDVDLHDPDFLSYALEEMSDAQNGTGNAKLTEIATSIASVTELEIDEADFGLVYCMYMLVKTPVSEQQSNSAAYRNEALWTYARNLHLSHEQQARLITYLEQTIPNSTE
jgi:hypothetical protein